MSSNVERAMIADLRGLLAGEVLDTGEALEAYSKDYGQIVRRTPGAVVRASKASDVQRVIRWAFERDIPVSTRGVGHSQRGQALNEGGIVIDMRGLAELAPIAPDARSFSAGPGVLWRQVVAAGAKEGLAPPVLTGYPHVTIGGTHSAGGWGMSSARHGAQIDNCIALEVVTAEGELVRCSKEQNAELFHHVLGGMGQFGIITRIEHALRRYLPFAREYTIEFEDLDRCLSANHTIATEGRASYFDCTISQRAQGFSYVIHATVEADSLETLDDRRLLDDLGFVRVEKRDTTTADFLSLPESKEKQSTPGFMHPWMVAFLPWSRLKEFMETCARRIPPIAFGGKNGDIRLSAAPRRVTNMPMLRMPSDETIVLVGLFPRVHESKLEVVKALMSKASDLALTLGGKRHLATWVHFDLVRWKMHFGDYWPKLNEVKRKCDPKGILNPGFIEFEK